MVYINPEGIRAMNLGRKLAKTASTPEEIAAGKAYKRVLWGTVILVLLFVAALTASMFWACSQEDSFGSIHRTGTVQKDGTVRYVQNDAHYLTLEELGLREAGLQPGDKVSLGFNNQDELISAMPKATRQAEQDLRWGVVIGVMILMIVALLIYALVICRYTPFGNAWYQYLRKQKQKEKDIPLKVKIVIYAVAAVIAFIICAPQISNIVWNIQQMQRIEENRKFFQSVQDAADRAQDLSDKLGQMENVAIPQDSIDDVKDATDTIKEILQDLTD